MKQNELALWLLLLFDFDSNMRGNICYVLKPVSISDADSWLVNSVVRVGRGPKELGFIGEFLGIYELMWGKCTFH